MGWGGPTARGRDNNPLPGGLRFNREQAVVLEVGSGQEPKDLVEAAGPCHPGSPTEGPR